jgi:hypothetical protein
VAAACPAAGQCHQEANMIKLENTTDGLSVTITPMQATIYEVVFRDEDSGAEIGRRVFLDAQQARDFAEKVLG